MKTSDDEFRLLVLSMRLSDSSTCGKIKGRYLSKGIG